MSPITQLNSKTIGATKSWRQIKDERKILKRERKQQKLLKTLIKANNVDNLNTETNVTMQSVINPSTVSIAVPGSILENAQSADLRSYLAGQIARAACIYRVNEVIVFDDVGISTARETKRSYDEASGSCTVRGSCLQLARILQYLECPQYLRKFFFPLHKDLKYSGLLNPLDAPHHLRRQNTFLYREGVISDKKAKEGNSYVNVGLFNDVLVNKSLQSGVRVTVKMDTANEISSKKQRGTIVGPDEPRRTTGVYWGYNVRIAHSLSEIFTKSPYEGGYDQTIGTSDRGNSVHELPNHSIEYNHLVIVFGGLQGLEEALANDEKITIDDPSVLFDHYLNVLPKQGTRTIRTEEALLIALATLQEKLKPQVPELKTDLNKCLPRSEDTGIVITRNAIVNKKKPKKQENNAREPKDNLYTIEHSNSISSSTDFEIVSAELKPKTVIETGDLSRFD